ncbi:MAG: PhoH family protein [Candidatus Omnitrophica bacterium]|nr:PhoH family protein [Candidatus Omnitrophota bacterium]MDD5430239.1 PhoH family protein [Candidatus Omnitrophota bacterium]
MQKIVTVEDPSYLSYIFGPNDANLKIIEEELAVSIMINSGGILLKGSKEGVDRTVYIIRKMTELAKEGFILSQQELIRYLGTKISGAQKSSPDVIDAKFEKLSVKVPLRKKLVFPKTQGQGEYIRAMREYDIVFSTGPAGTGKTYLAMAMAVNALTTNSVRRIILTRPAIEAGESLGFLPGDMREKLGPYLRPLYDALYDMMDAEVIESHLETGIIEIVPLAYMRGRTLNSAFVILDEAQNCTCEQLRMFLTRLGFDSKTVITGDVTQSDLPQGQPGGLLEAINLLKGIKGIKFINLDKKDVVRHPLIQKIIQVYENFYNKKTN